MKPPISPKAQPDMSLSSGGLSLRPALKISEGKAATGVPSALRRHAPRNRFQRLVQQCLLLLPLATACAGTAALHLVDDSEEVLPPLFFTGALLVTVAMLHQRSLLRRNEELTQSVQAAHEQLDRLHRLELALNETLDVHRLCDIVLTHAQEVLGARAGALWLAPHFDMQEDRAAHDHETHSIEILRGAHWTCMTRRGSKAAAFRGVLESCHRALNSSESQQLPTFDSDVVPDGEEAVGVPIFWRNEQIGVLLLLSHRGELPPETRENLEAIALVAAPSLQNALLYSRAAARADMDGLTGLYNHRAVQERLGQEVARASRAANKGVLEPLSLVVFDLTDFKIFNDTYGHSVGDEVLRTVAQCLRQNFRAGDIVSRYGGDEFLALMPETDFMGAQALCARIIQTIESQRFEASGQNVQIRTACGIAVYPDDGSSASDLFAIADNRLYEAKGRGVPLVINSASGASGQLISLPRVGLDGHPLDEIWPTFGVLNTLITAIDNRDRYTRRYSEHVATLALRIGQELKLSREMLEAIQTSSLLHDVGKVAVPDAILRKPGRLTTEETQQMQQHTEFGPLIVRGVPHLERVLEGVRSHHECWNGSGYPDALEGEKIPFIARLLAVPVCFAAMTTSRPYRSALLPEEALSQIKAARGTQFDPQIVDAFVRVLESKQVEIQTEILPLITSEHINAARETVPVA